MTQGWKENNTDYSIISNGKGIKVWADGTIDLYIINSGVRKVMSKDVTVAASYYIY